jgi:hypothetical protein
MRINDIKLTDKEKENILAFFKNDGKFSEYSQHLNYILDLYSRLPLNEIKLFINILEYKKLKTKQNSNLNLDGKEKIILSEIEKDISNLLNK